LYQRYVTRLETWLDVKIPFRIAETPFFISRPLRQKLATAAREIVAQISDRKLIAHMSRAIPPALDVPRIDSLANCLQVDFAIVQGEDGELTGKVVELQGFPSLYALMVLQSDAMSAELQAIEGLDHPWSLYYSGNTRESFVAKFKHALLAGNEPE